MKKYLSLLALLSLTTVFSQTEVHEKVEPLNKGLGDVPSLIYTGIGGILFSAGVVIWFSRKEE